MIRRPSAIDGYIDAELACYTSAPHSRYKQRPMDTISQPSQYLPKRGKTRSWPPGKRGIVYDPGNKSLKIRRIKEIERERLSQNPSSQIEYTSCEIPSSNIINVFQNSRDGEVGTSDQDGNIFIGRLNLEQLGLMDKFSRMLGQLKTLYIVKGSLPIE
ncbi:hypothetical protein B7494_g5221 [Chlorociboria aeruginascens]|nr:hypothetical protein B7494_g5221 [Chlorociboria aeruginascens]